MRFAQILHGKAHWIFESEAVPEFAPNIKIIDITDKPAVREGWNYDEETGVFTAPKAVEPTNPEPTETQILMDFIVDVDYRVSRLELGMEQ